MPFALTTIGLLMIVTGVRGTHATFASEVRDDGGAFLKWIVALIGAGSLGYVEKLEGLSNAIMALIIVSMVLSNKGFFVQLQDAINRGPEPPPKNTCGDPIKATPDNAGSLLERNRQGFFGQSPGSEGQGKFNAWMNWLFGTGVKDITSSP